MKKILPMIMISLSLSGTTFAREFREGRASFGFSKNAGVTIINNSTSDPTIEILKNNTTQPITTKKKSCC